MQLHVVEETIAGATGDVLLVGMFQEEPLPSTLQQIDQQFDGYMQKLVKEKLFKAEFKETQVIPTFGKLMVRKLILVGLGKKEDATLDMLRKASGFGAKVARSEGAKIIASALHLAELNDVGLQERSKASAEGFLMGLYQFIHHKTIDAEKIKIVDQVKLLADSSTKATVLAASKEAEILVSATNLVRNLVNEPANIVTPTVLAEEAKKIAQLPGMKVKIMDEKEAAKKGMLSFLSVTQGSDQPAKFIVLEYGKGNKSIAFVGKGITFDSGGYSLKPPKYQEDMKTDMGGAAAVLGTMKAIAELKLPIKAYGVIATCENMVNGSATKPGDIVKASNGKTIEILNTDAEGRLILADALHYTETELKPQAIVDLATLTGACVVALGHEATAVMGTDEELISKLRSAGERTGERVWELPLWDSYKEKMNSDIADVRNISVAPGGEAGTITAAVFLNHFVEKTKWAHLDIAGTAYITEEKDYLPKGATGVGPRLLVELVKRL